MKHVVFYALTAGLVVSTGCSKQEEAAAEAAPKVPVSEQAQTLVTDVKQKAVDVKDQAVEKAVDLTAQATEKVTAVVEKTKVAAQELSQKAQTVMKELTVNKEDVLAELDQPVANIKAKVADLGQPALLAYASTYKDVLLEKKDQLAGLTEQLKALPMGDMLGSKGKAIKDQLSQYTSQLSGLKDRYSIYLDQLKALGVDLSSFVK